MTQIDPRTTEGLVEVDGEGGSKWDEAANEARMWHDLMRGIPVFLGFVGLAALLIGGYVNTLGGGAIFVALLVAVHMRNRHGQAQ
jgi:hypothetical protein